jgi:hypothetical protein
MAAKFFRLCRIADYFPSPCDDSIDRQVYATTIAEGLTVVEERHAMTDVLQQVGLDIAIPGE